MYERENVERRRGEKERRRQKTNQTQTETETETEDRYKRQTEHNKAEVFSYQNGEKLVNEQEGVIDSNNIVPDRH